MADGALAKAVRTLFDYLPVFWCRRERASMNHWPTRTTEAGVVVVRPEGRLNMVSAKRLRDQLCDLVDAGKIRLVVDLSGVGTVDSSGLGALITALKAARRSGGDLRIAAVGAQAASVLELTNLNQLLKTYPSAEDAFREPSANGEVLR